MKKKIILVLFILLVCFSGCTQKTQPPAVQQAEENVVGTDYENTVQDAGNNADGNASEKQQEIVTPAVLPELLDVNGNSFYLYEIHDDCPEFLVKTKFSVPTLSSECAKTYPALAHTLETSYTMVNNTMSDEFDNFLAFAREDADTNGFDNWKPYTSRLDIGVRRADSVAFSTLSDTYTDTPYIKDFRSLMGSSYDTQTGKELLITDVVKDMSLLPEIVKKEITSHMWTGDFYSENVLEEYFRNTRAEDVYWTLDYNGVTFYFYAGCIAQEENGIITATVSFEQYPEVFVEKYMNVPESYSVRIPVTASFFTDLDGNGVLDELVLTAHKDEDFGHYSELYIITADSFHEEEFFAYNINPYYIKTADGRHLLYVFGEGAEDFNRLMRLYVYDITGGEVKKIGAMPIAPHHSVNDDSADVFALPVNPDKMHFDFFTEEPDFQYPVFNDFYRVGANHIPVREGEREDIPDAPDFNPEGFEEIGFTESELFGTRWQGYIYVDQQSGVSEECSKDFTDYSFVSLEFFKDGRGIVKYDGDYADFDFYCDTPASGVLSLGDIGSKYFSIYKDTQSTDETKWIMMQMDENILWLYRI